KQVTELMRQYHAHFKEAKYREAEMYAMRAHELDPDNPMTDAAIYIARTMGNQTSSDAVKDRSRTTFEKGMNQAIDPGPYVNSDNPVSFDPKVTAQNKNRKEIGIQILGTKTEKERQIESKLTSPISLNFSDTPLKQVLDDLRDWTSLNIV